MPFSTIQVLLNPSYQRSAAAVSAKMQLWYSFRRPVQRAADEVEILFAGSMLAKAGGNKGHSGGIADHATEPQLTGEGSTRDSGGAGNDQMEDEL